MATYKDIRVKFQTVLNEAKKLPYSQDFSKQVRDLLIKNKIRGNKTQNLSELRFGVTGDPQQTQIWLAATIFPNIDGKNYTLTYEAPDRAKKGEAKSGTYYTHKITIVNPIKIGKYKAKPGDICWVIDNLKAQSNIQNKMLTPDGLGLGGKTYKDSASLKNDVDQKLSALVKDENISEPHKEFMLDLLDGVINSTKTSFGSMSDVVAGHSTTIAFTSEITDQISDPDIAKIAKDYGEILGGAYMERLVSSTPLGLSFPTESNEPLVDFYIDGQSISMKAGGGAAPSLSNIGKLIQKDPKKWEKLMSSDDQKLMLNVVRNFHERTAAEGLFYVAELIEAPGWTLLKQLMDNNGLTAKACDKATLNTFVRDLFTKTPDEAYDKFDKYFKALGKYPDGWDNKELQIENALARKEAFGLIFSPLAYHVKDALNDNEFLIEALSEVVQKFDVLQLYIDLRINKTKKYQMYTLKKFAEGKFLFNATPSVNLPTRNKFGFKMVKK
jgi:hypothetical protein